MNSAGSKLGRLRPRARSAGRIRLPNRWVLLAILVIPFAAIRIHASLRSAEEQIQVRLISILDSLEDRNPRRLVNGLSRRYEDEDTGYGRRDVRDWANSLVAPGQRYRATLHEPDGIKFLAQSEEGVKPKTATVQVRCLIERRSRTTEFKPWWDLEFTADMVRRDGSWKIRRTRGVNHSERPR